MAQCCGHGLLCHGYVYKGEETSFICKINLKNYCKAYQHKNGKISSCRSGLPNDIFIISLLSSSFLWKEIGLPPTSIHGARECHRVVKATAFAWGATEGKVTGMSSREPRSFVVCHINMCMVPLLQRISIYGLVKMEAAT